MKGLRAEIRRSEDFVPRPEHTASAAGNPHIDVVATTALILFIEAVCDDLARPGYDRGEATVGVRVEVDHLAPARVGIPVEVSCELTEVDGRRLVFAAEVRQAGTLVMKGYHHRVVVAHERFSAAGSTPQRGA